MNKFWFFLLLFAASLCAQERKTAPDRPTDWGTEVLYFVIVDRFADGDPTNNDKVKPDRKGYFHGGDLKGLTKHLDEIADLGVTALWITPVVQQIPGYVDGAGFPDWGYHGYWADDFYAMDPRFGSEADLSALVDAAHARDMKVLLDVVYNHAGYDSAYTKDPKTRDWLRTEQKGDCGGGDLTGCLSGLPDFKTEDPEVAEYLMRYARELARRTGLDGFRLDTVKHIDHPFWREHRKRLDETVGEDFHLLGEIWGGDHRNLDGYFAHDEIDSGFDFGFKGSVQAFVQGRGRTVAFSRYLLKRHQIREGYLMSHYLSSHDVPGSLYELDGDKELFKLCVAIQMTSLGMPCIYYGEEVGRLGGDWPDNRSHMPWGEKDIQPGKGEARDEDMYAWYKKLIGIRKARPALAVGGYEEISTEGDLLVFGRFFEGEVVWVAVNRGAAPAEAVLTAPDPWQKHTPSELIAGAAVAIEDGALTVSVPPRSVRIYAVDRE